MADEQKKRPSVQDILRMARGDAGGGASPPPKAAPPAAKAPPTEPTSIEPASAPEKPAAEPVKKPAAKPAAKAASGGRPSIAEILAQARGGGGAPSGEAPPPAAKPKPAVEAKPKPAPKAAPAPVAESPAAPSGPKDTASILAAARKQAKPGPITKAEAAKLKADEAKPAGEKPTLPPMPEKPAFARRESPAAKAPAAGSPAGGKSGAAKAAAEGRRGFMATLFGSFLGVGFSSLGLTHLLWGLGTTRFMFPNVLAEPPTKFKVGFPDQYPPGSVEEKFKSQFGVWIVRAEYEGQEQIFALQTVCTHLGCTPNWLEGEQKFKCPCHGSGFYKDGINFEGPAPRPLERYVIRIADDGQIEVDKSRTFKQEMGEWSESASFVQV